MFKDLIKKKRANVTRRTRKSALFFRNIIFFPAILLCIWPTYIILIAICISEFLFVFWVPPRILPRASFFPSRNKSLRHWQKFCANKFVCSFIFYVSSSNTFLIACYITTTYYCTSSRLINMLFYIIHTFTYIKKNWCSPKSIQVKPPFRLVTIPIVEGYIR